MANSSSCISQQQRQLQKQWAEGIERKFSPKTKDKKSVYQLNSEKRYRSAVRAALEKGYLKVLDEDLILDSQHDRDESIPTDIHQVQRIDLRWGCVHSLDQVSLLSCQNLRICNLTGCFVHNIEPFYGCSKLLKLDLADNQISQLPHLDFWKSLSSLRVLYLSGNLIVGIEEILKLGKCPSLHVLTLHSTPLALNKKYRHYVVNSILTLKAFDAHVISDEEIIENLKSCEMFRALSNNFKLQLYAVKLGSSPQEEVCLVYQLLLAVDKILAKYSPVVILQRYIRGWLTRRDLLKSANSKIRGFIKKRLFKKSSSRSSQVRKISHAVDTIQDNFVTSKPRPQSYTTYPPTPHLSDVPHKAGLPAPPPTSPRPPQPCDVFPHLQDIHSSRLRYEHMLHGLKHPSQVNHEEGEELEWLRKAKMKQARDNFRLEKRKMSRRLVSRMDPSNAMKSDEWDWPYDKLKKDKRKEAEGDGDDDVSIHTLPPVKSHDITRYSSDYKDSSPMKNCISTDKKCIKEIIRLRKEEKGRRRNRSAEKDVLSKDDVFFRRAYATLSLSALMDLDRAKHMSKRDKELKQMADHVSQQWSEDRARCEKVRMYRKMQQQELADWAYQHREMINFHMNNAEEERRELNTQKMEKRKKTLEASEGLRHALESSKTFMQKIGTLNNFMKEDYREYKENNQDAFRDLVRLQHEEWMEEKERKKLLQEEHKASLFLSMKGDMKIMKQQQMQASAADKMERKVHVNELYARHQAAHRSIEDTKRNLLTARLGSGRKGPRPFVLETGTIPSSGYGHTVMGSSRYPLYRMSQIKEGIETRKIKHDDSKPLAVGGTKALFRYHHQQHPSTPNTELLDYSTDIWTPFSEFTDTTVTPAPTQSHHSIAPHPTPAQGHHSTTSPHLTPAQGHHSTTTPHSTPAQDHHSTTSPHSIPTHGLHSTSPHPTPAQGHHSTPGTSRSTHYDNTPDSATHTPLSQTTTMAQT